MAYSEVQFAGPTLVVMRRVLLSVVASVLLIPSAAFAQSGAALLDPDSPAGREYALPLDAARTAGSTADAPEPFGAGINAAGPAERLRDVSESDRASRVDAGGSALIAGLAGLVVLLAAMGSAGLRRSHPST